MDAMEHRMAEWRRRMPSKRALTSQLGQFVQQKSVQVLYTQSEQDRIKAVTELIQAATSEFDKSPHYDRIMKVVDAVSNTSNKNVLKEAIRFLRLRLGDPSPRVALLALALAEALMNNCNRYVHKEIGSEAFMAEMEALYKVHSCKRGRDSMEIEGRVLELVQAWGETFMNQKFEFPYFIYTYQKLRKKGVKFPKFDKTRAPMINSAGALSPAAQRRAREAVAKSSGSSKASSAAAAGLAKLTAKEVYHVATNVAEMFEDMLNEAEQENDASAADTGVIVELGTQAHELAVRLQAMIQAAADSDSDELGKYLSINDTLHLLLTRYDDLKSGKTRRSSSTGQPKKQAASSSNDDAFDGWAAASSNQQDNDDDDDGFGDFVRARVGGGDSKKPAASASVMDNQADEDDPFASFAAQRTTKSAAPAAAAAAPEPAAKNLIDLWDDVPAQPTLAAAPAAAPVSDLWGSDELLVPAAPAAAPTAAAPFTQPTKPQASPFDDLWGDLAASTPAPSVAPVAPVVPAQANTSTANPFDFFDDFSTKATISSPAPTPAPAAPATKPNPFDFGFPPAPTSQAPTSQSPPAPASKPANAPMTALNPFDV